MPPSPTPTRSPLLEIGVTLLIPSLILIQLSKPEQLGAAGALVLALAFPIGWGLRELAKSRGFGLFAEGGYRDALDDSSDPVRVGLYNNPAQVLEREVEDPFGGQFLASAGVEGSLGPVKVTIAYRGRYGEHADSHMGGVQLRLPL